jgi:hypothetical protein
LIGSSVRWRALAIETVSYRRSPAAARHIFFLFLPFSSFAQLESL